MLISKRQLRRLIESAIYEQTSDPGESENYDDEKKSMKSTASDQKAKQGDSKLKSKMKATADAKKDAQKSIKSKISSGGKQVIPKEVRAELKKLRLEGLTCLAFDGEGNQGLAIRVGKFFQNRGSGRFSIDTNEEDEDLAIARLKKLYGEDRVLQGVAKRLQGGSAGIKNFDGVRLESITKFVQVKKYFSEDYLTDEAVIFINMEKPKKASQPAGTISEQFRTFSDLAKDMLNESSAQNLDSVQQAAIDLYDAMDGMGTNETDIREIFESMREDVNTLRKVAYLYGAISRGGSLYEDLLSEMGEGDIRVYVEQSFPGAMDILKR